MSDPYESSDTDTIYRGAKTPVSSALCEFDRCPMEPSFKRYVDKKIAENQKSEVNFWMKIAGAILPFIVSGFIWLNGLEDRVIAVEYQQSEITQLKNDVRELKDEVIGLRIQIERILARLEREENGN